MLQAKGFADAIGVLLEPMQHRSVAALPWPRSAKATVNFCQYAAGGVEASHDRLHRIDHIAMLPDSSLVAISNREAEYLLRADRQLRQQDMRMHVAVSNLTFVWPLHPVTPDASGRGCWSTVIPWHALGSGLSFEASCTYKLVAANVVAAQLFNGETDFVQQDTEAYPATAAEREHRRKNVLRTVLFGSPAGELPVKAANVVSGVKVLTHSRGRGVFWEGSMLEDVCIEEENRLQLRGL